MKETTGNSKNCYLFKYLFCWLVLFGFLHVSSVSFSQDTIKRVTLNKSDFESIITYAAKDSIYSDFKLQQVHLFGNAKLEAEGIRMNAGYLLIDLKKKEVLATYRTDSLGNKLEQPVFVDGTDTIQAASIRYNFETKKGYIQEVTIKQQDYYLSMETAKRQANEEVHFVHGKFTSCDLKEPHYHFHLSKAVLVPEKRIVTGPMNLWIMGVPTPLGLPMAIIPQKKEREKLHGFLMPKISLISPYGMGVNDLGYYIPINDHWQTTATATVFSRGSFGIGNKTNYNYKYKFNGNFGLSYDRFRFGWPDSSIISAVAVDWTHQQDPKANPNLNFSANVHFNSNSSNKQTLNLQNDNYFNNTLNSDVRITRKFGSKPLSADLKLAVRQNSASQQIDVTSPIFNFQTTSRVFPWKRINKIFGISYAAEVQNRASTRSPYLSNGDFDSIASAFRNGATQRFNLQGSFGILRNAIRISPSVNYSNFYNFQTIEKTFDLGTNSVLVDTLNEGGFTHRMDASVGATANLFSYYRFVGKKQTLLRHVLTPTVSFVYSPDIQEGIASYTDNSGNTIRYSRFERSLYGQGVGAASGRIAFAINNSFELKQKNAKDTLTGFKKFRLIDNLFFATDYDIFKDSMNWSDLSMRMVINPVQGFNITLNASHSWYAWNDTTGKTLSTYAVNSGQGLGRIKLFNAATSYTLTPKKFREQVDAQRSAVMNTWNPQYQRWLSNPNHVVLFEVPWTINLAYNYSMNLLENTANYQNQRYSFTNALELSGDISITENWKITSRMMLDLKTNTVNNLNITMNRNLHCWTASFIWIPIGTNKSFSVGIRGSAAALQNVNLNLRKPPIVL